jgi:hypothetical protein
MQKIITKLATVKLEGEELYIGERWKQMDAKTINISADDIIFTQLEHLAKVTINNIDKYLGPYSVIGKHVMSMQPKTTISGNDFADTMNKGLTDHLKIEIVITMKNSLTSAEVENKFTVRYVPYIKGNEKPGDAVWGFTSSKNNHSNDDWGNLISRMQSKVSRKKSSNKFAVSNSITALKKLTNVVTYNTELSEVATTNETTATNLCDKILETYHANPQSESKQLFNLVEEHYDKLKKYRRGAKIYYPENVEPALVSVFEKAAMSISVNAFQKAKRNKLDGNDKIRDMATHLSNFLKKDTTSPTITLTIKGKMELINNMGYTESYRVPVYIEMTKDIDVSKIRTEVDEIDTEMPQAARDKMILTVVRNPFTAMTLRGFKRKMKVSFPKDILEACLSLREVSHHHGMEARNMNLTAEITNAKR